jgi:hypothetical protein
MEMSQTEAEAVMFSNHFPPGYGDFNIQSSDRVVFSFPSGVLSHASPVFKDMFAFGDPSTRNNQTPLVVTEDVVIILIIYLIYRRLDAR